MNEYIVLDIETTGFSPENHQITEIGALRVKDGQILEIFSQLINPGVEIPKEITELTGISDETVKGMPGLPEVMPKFVAFLGNLPILGHNILFDYSFLKTAAISIGVGFEKKGVDTLSIARGVLPGLESRSLTFLCNYFSINRVSEHRAYDDAKATHILYELLRERYRTEGNCSLFEAKPLYYKIAKSEPITPKQEKYLMSLLKQKGLVLARPIQELTKSEASREIDRIINQYGKSV